MQVSVHPQLAFEVVGRNQTTHHPTNKAIQYKPGSTNSGRVHVKRIIPNYCERDVIRLHDEILNKTRYETQM